MDAVSIGLAIVAGFIAFYVLKRVHDKQVSPSRFARPQRYAPVIAAGLIMIGLGFAIYLPSTVRDQDFRTFYYSSLGGAITMTAVVGWITIIRLRRPVLFAFCIGILTFLATLRLLDQHRSYVERSDTQQATALQLAGTVRQMVEETNIIVIDDTYDQSLQRVFGASWYFRAIMDILYQNYGLGAALCYPELTAPWGGYQETCQFSEQGVTTTETGNVFLYTPYDRTVVVRYTSDGFAIEADLSLYIANLEIENLYQPERLLIPDSDLPPRAYSLFAH